MKTFNETIWVEGIKDYYNKAKLIQGHYYEDNATTSQTINYDLIWNVPIYDVVNRKYAAFNTLITALWYGKQDPKQNGDKYDNLKLNLIEWIYVFYTFRLTGSGINYKENHGFGNCLHQHFLPEITDITEMANYFKNHTGPFSDSKGYQLPLISYKHLNGGHLRHHCSTDAVIMARQIADYITKGSKKTIVEVADFICDWYSANGHRRWKFVATAAAMDLAEFFPQYVDPTSEVYVGSNAIRCLKLTLPKKRGVDEHIWYNDALDYLIDITGATINKYDAEDTLGCDPIRYFQEFQSPDHIRMNDGNVYKNNSIMKQILGEKEYYEKSSILK